MKVSEDKILQLVGMIYDASLDESKWSSFLEYFASTIGGASAILRSNDTLTKSASFNASVSYDPAWQAAYCNHFVDIDFFNQAMSQYSPGKVFISTKDIDQAELHQSEYFNDYLKPQDKENAMGAFLYNEGGRSLVLGVQRGRRAGAFGDKESKLISTLIPHIARAVKVHRKIHTVTAEKEQAHGALDQMRIGVILTNRFGIPLYINRAAELMMTQDIGLGIFHNKLATHSPSETTQLLKLIYDTAISNYGSSVGGDMRITMPNKVEYLHCVVTPVSPEVAFVMGNLDGTDCIAVFLSKPGGLQLSPKRLVALYKITPAEARLTARLAALRTVEEASEDLGVSLPTVRSQLRSVFAKTGTRSQSELLMLLATGTLAHISES